MNTNTLSQLNQELAELRKFVALLTAEQQSLLSNDTENLLTISISKTQAASLLLDMGNSRRKSLLTGTTSTMEDWISKNAPNSKTLWNEIRKLAEQAQNLNVTNGELIQSRMRHNQQSLGVLFNSSASTAGVYGRDGQANLGHSGRHLGSG